MTEITSKHQECFDMVNRIRLSKLTIESDTLIHSLPEDTVKEMFLNLTVGEITKVDALTIHEFGLINYARGRT